jgi:hypothetical protein
MNLPEINAKARKIILDNKFKIIEDETSEDLIVFYKTDFQFYLQIEEEDCFAYGLSDIGSILLGESFYQRFDENGESLDQFEEFLLWVNDGRFDYIKKMYKAVEVLKEKFEDNEEDLKWITEYLID